MPSLNDANALISGLQSGAGKQFDRIDKIANPEGLARQTQAIQQNAKNGIAEFKNRGKKIIDLGKRFEKAFGFISANKSAELKRAGFDKSVATANVFLRDTKTTFEKVVLIGSGITVEFGYTDINTGLGNVFAPPPMVSFSKKKRMERTVLDGVDGEVVEKYGHEPWIITIQGLLIDMENHKYPASKIEALVSLFEKDAIWAVESEIFLNHGIKTIYFEEIDDSGVVGFEDTWQYTLKGYSIKPVEFFLKK